MFYPLFFYVTFYSLFFHYLTSNKKEWGSIIYGLAWNQLFTTVFDRPSFYSVQGLINYFVVHK